MECRRLFNEKMIMLIAVCMMLNCVFFIYREMSSTQLRNDYDRYVSAKESYIEEYNTIVDNVFENAEKMTTFGIFTRQDSFAYNNILRTRSDFERIKDVEVKLHDDRALEAVLDYDVSFVIVFAIMIMLVYNMFLERDNGFWQISHCTKSGRAKLALERLGIIIAASGLILMLFYASIILMSVLRYGIDDISSPAQELIGFARFTNAYSKAEYIVYLYLITWFVVSALSVCTWALMTIVRERNHALVMIAVIIGIEFLLRKNIDSKSVYNALYYVNIISILDTNELLTTYLNWGFKTYIFARYQACILMMFLISAGLGCLAVIKYDEMAPKTGAAGGFISKILNAVKLRYHKVMSHYGMIMMEIHKVFITGKGIWVLVAVLISGIYFCTSEKMYYTDSAKNKDAYYAVHGGKDYSYIENMIEEESEKYHSLLETQEEKQKLRDEGLIDAEEYMEAASAVPLCEQHGQQSDWLKMRSRPGEDYSGCKGSETPVAFDTHRQQLKSLRLGRRRHI